MDSQSRRDAMADAETLRRVAFSVHSDYDRRYGDYVYGRAGERIREAFHLADQGATVMLHTEHVARAAFRACPMLRDAE